MLADERGCVPDNVAAPAAGMPLFLRSQVRKPLGVHTALSFSADSQGEPKLPQHGAERVLERRRGVAARAVAARPRAWRGPPLRCPRLPLLISRPRVAGRES